MIDNREKLYEALDLIAKGVTRPSAISRALGISYRCYRMWMVRSNRGDPAFLIEVDGVDGKEKEVIQWAKAITLSTKLALLELRGMVLQEAIYGYDEEQTKDGNVVWALDPVACAMSEDEREALGFRRDGLLVVNGRLVPHTVRKKAPFAQQLALLRAAFPDLREQSTINQNVAVSGAVGIGFTPRTDYSRGPPSIPPAPKMPELAAPVDAEFSEIEADDFEDILGPPPVPAPVNVVIAPQITVTPLTGEAPEEPERVIVSAPTAAETPPKQEGILAPKTTIPAGWRSEWDKLAARATPTGQEIFDKLKAAREKSQ